MLIHWLHICRIMIYNNLNTSIYILNEYCIVLSLLIIYKTLYIKKNYFNFKHIS